MTGPLYAEVCLLMDVKHIANFVNSDTVPTCENKYVQCFTECVGGLMGCVWPHSDTELKSASVFSVNKTCVMFIYCMCRFSAFSVL